MIDRYPDDLPSEEELQMQEEADGWADLFEREMERLPSIKDTPFNLLETADVLLLAYSLIQEHDLDNEMARDYIYEAWKQTWGN